MANEGLGWDLLLKMSYNPGGDWHPGRGDNPSYIPLPVIPFEDRCLGPKHLLNMPGPGGPESKNSAKHVD